MLFNINKRSPRAVNSLLTPSTAYVRGTAMQESATAGQAELADGSKPFAGFQTRDSEVGGPALSDVIYPGRLELPFATTEEGSYEYAEEVEAEGAQFLDSSITGSNALKTALTFTNGQFKVAGTGNYVEFILVQNMTPEVSGNIRIRVRAVQGYVHA